MAGASTKPIFYPFSTHSCKILLPQIPNNTNSNIPFSSLFDRNLNLNLSFQISFKLQPPSTLQKHSPNSLLTDTQTPKPQPQEQQLIHRFSPNEPRKGCDVLIEALELEGVTDVFAYPGGASIEIHQALTWSQSISNVLPRHEQGGFSSPKATLAPRAVWVSALPPKGPVPPTSFWESLMCLPRRMLGTDAFLETPIVEVTRSITKHNYLVLDVEDIPRVVKEAFFLANPGRPGPILIDIPKDIQE
ncbi:ALS SURB: Acetolactate synthase 2 chloroplastic [Bienertia sinuspersici]